EEALTFCVAFGESGGRALSADFAGFSARDLFLLLAYGRAEANDQIFGAAFDRLLIPKLRAAKGSSLVAMLDRTHNLGLRDFAAAALVVHRLDPFLQVAGGEVMARLAIGIEHADDPLQAAVTVAEVIDGASGHSGLETMATAVAAEFTRCREA